MSPSPRQQRQAQDFDQAGTDDGAARVDRAPLARGSTSVELFELAAGAMLAGGVAGLIPGVPMRMCLKLCSERVPSWRWLARSIE